MSKLGLTGLYTRILFSLQQPLESLENQRPNHKCRTFLDFNLSLSTGSCPMPHKFCLGFSLPLLLLKNNNKKDSTLGNTLQEVLTVICTKMISSHTMMLEKKSHRLTIQGRTAQTTANHRILAQLGQVDRLHPLWKSLHTLALHKGLKMLTASMCKSM